MILYRHRELGATHANLPAELVGFRALADDTAICHGFDDEGHVVGLCSPILWQGAKPDQKWSPIADGWEASSDGRDFTPLHHLRAAAWCNVVPVKDAKDRTWFAPAILGSAGARAFPIAYGGPDMLPQLTPDQEKAIRIATECRTLLQAAVEGGAALQSEQIIPWAAWAITLPHHLSVPTIGAQLLLDETLAARVIAVMAGVEL